MTDALRDRIVRMAWEDRTTFEEIEQRTGLAEKDVIKVMRDTLKRGSFRLWRKRVTGRVTKHRKLMKRRGISSQRQAMEDEEVGEGFGREVAVEEASASEVEEFLTAKSVKGAKFPDLDFLVLKK